MSAANLLAYVELRRHNLASLQLELADLGLSSLGRLEGHVLSSLENVLRWLGAPDLSCSHPLRVEAEGVLAQRSVALFGRPRPARNTRIMVTLDHELPNPLDDVRGLLRAGMDIARINCGHGTFRDWHALVQAIRTVEAEFAAAGNPLPRRCRILVDLGGPHLRVADVPDGLRVGAGDVIRLSLRPGPVGIDDPGAPPIFTCTLPEALASIETGHRIFIDDGKVGGRVITRTGNYVDVQVDRPVHRPKRLKPEKGINLPDTPIALPALTAQDREDLHQLAPLADVVGLSFVHGPDDVRALRQALIEEGRPALGIVAKIETRQAARNLAAILLAGLSLPAFGVMIARGDLAVEVGFEDLAVVQENILCLCESAHVPAVWATQVLETLAHSGLPARAEITDAAASQRADCVMLNKGPNVVDAVALLDRLLTAELRHRSKKRDVFREFMAQDLTGVPALLGRLSVAL